MTRRRSRSALTSLAVAGTLALALGAGATSASAASRSCGVVTAGGKPYIVVAKNVTCASAARVVRGFTARMSALRAGQKVVVPSPLAGFTCVLNYRTTRAGACSTVGATKSIVWIGTR